VLVRSLESDEGRYSVNINTPDYWSETYHRDDEASGGALDRCYRYDLGRFEPAFHYLQGRTLDVGCGLGYFSAYCLARGKAIDGCDFSEWAINEAQKKLPTLDFFITDIGQLSENAPGLYDTVISQEVIEHLDEPESLLTEAKAILKPGGRIIVITPLIYPDGTFHSGEHLFEYSADEFADVMERHFQLTDAYVLQCNYGQALMAVGVK
jgi:2-polyprenyl-3-methyl-5-hydroxy-6-metoxy-1,4-benzoquinol methylase